MDSSRIQRFQDQCEIPCLIENPSDLFYLTGLCLSLGKLLISSSRATLFVDGRYYEVAKAKAPCPVFKWEDFKSTPDGKIAFDSSFVTYQNFLNLKNLLPLVEWVPLASPLKHLRVLKEAKEIQALKKAAALTRDGIQRVASLLKEGMSEEELAFEFEFYCRKEGAMGLSFETIIAFGENSAYPHHRTGKAKLKHNQVVLVDAGAIVDSYHGDLTRIFHFGKPDPRIVHLEQIVKRAKEKALQHIRPGIHLKELDEIVRAEFDRDHVKQLYMHSLGHGVGLETHEFPRIKFDGEDRDLILKSGMVFTIEPGLYQAGLGGIRLEDMILVTENGHEKL